MLYQMRDDWQKTHERRGAPWTVHQSITGLVKCLRRSLDCSFYLLYTPCHQLACIHTCEMKACISPFFACVCMCARAYTVNRLWVCLKEWGMSVCLYVWVCVSLVFPGLNSRVALGAERPGCNTLIVELFTLYSNPLHPHFGRVPLPLA